MANKSLFATYAGKLLPRPNRRNRAGAPAHAYEPRHQLAQLLLRRLRQRLRRYDVVRTTKVRHLPTYSFRESNR